MGIYIAEYYNGKPEVVLCLPPREGVSLGEFRLMDEVGVTLCFSPNEHPLGWKTGKWGELKKELLASGESFAFAIEVLKDRWEYNNSPNILARHIDDIAGQIRRRNLQIKDLRQKLTAARQR